MADPHEDIRAALRKAASIDTYGLLDTSDAYAALELLQSRAAENTKGIAFGQGLPPAGGWKRHMVEDPTEYSPEFQDEYRRLWHEAASERDEALARVREVEAERDKLKVRAESAERQNAKGWEFVNELRDTVARQAGVLQDMAYNSPQGRTADWYVHRARRAVLASPEAAASEPEHNRENVHYDGEAWHAYCSCGWECWEQPTKQAAIERHEDHAAIEAAALPAVDGNKVSFPEPLGSDAATEPTT